MKKLALLLALLLAFSLNGQVPARHNTGVVIGDLSGTGSDPAGSNPGQIYWNDTNKIFRQYDGTVWANLGVAGVITNTSDLTNDGSDGANPFISFADFYQTNTLINGGYYHIIDYDYYVWADLYTIDGQVYSNFISETETLATAHATLNRIDVIVINSSETISVITGTPATNPIKPDVDVVSQVEVTFVLVIANTTAPPVTNELVYDENLQESGGEWDTSATSGAIDLASTNGTPQKGTINIEFTNAATSDWVYFTLSSTINLNDWQNLIFHVKNINDVGGAKIGVQFSNSTTEATVGGLFIAQFGYDSTNTSTWQTIVIPTAKFRGRRTTSREVDRFRIRCRTATMSFYLDNITLQKGTEPPELVEITNTSQLINDGEDGINAFITALDTPTLAIPSTEIVFGNATSDDITSNSNLIYNEGLNTFSVINGFAGTSVSGTYVRVTESAGNFVEISDWNNKPTLKLYNNNNGILLNAPTVTADRDITFQDADGELAFTDDIPIIDDTAYNETTWNANLDGATKNAIRDKFETFGVGDDVSTFAEKTGDLIGTDRLVGNTGGTDFLETINQIPLSIFNNDNLVEMSGTGGSNEIPTFNDTNRIVGEPNLTFSSTYTLEIGENDVDDGKIYLYGDASSQGGTIRLYNDATADSNEEFWSLRADSTGDLKIGRGATGSSIVIDDASDMITMLNGELELGIAGGQGQITIFGGLTTDGGYIDIQNGNDVDTNVNSYRIGANTDGDFQIAESTFTTPFFTYDETNEDITFNQYGDGTNTGTATFSLAVDTNGKLIEEEIGSFRLEEDVDVTGTKDIDWSLFETFYYELDGTTTFSDTNLPASGSKVITIYMKGNFVPTWPSGWTTYINGSYSSPADELNQIVIEYVKAGTPFWKVQITQPD